MDVTASAKRGWGKKEGKKKKKRKGEYKRLRRLHTSVRFHFTETEHG